MNNQVSYDDIKSKRINVYGLAYNYDPMKLQTNGYKQFSNKVDKMPKKYTDLVTQLNAFYQNMAPDIADDFERLKETVHQNGDDSHNQFEWYNQDAFTGEMSEEQIDFLLHSPQFKSYTMNTSNDRDNLLFSITRCQPTAIDIYFKIDEMLDGEGFETPDILRNTSLADSTQAEPLVGYYEQVSGPVDSRFGTSIEVMSRGKQLYVNTSDKEILLHYYDAYKMYFYIAWSSTILKFNPNENEDLTIIGGNEDERKWRKVIKSKKK